MKPRIEAIIDKLQLSPGKFADEVGIQRSGISHILSGRNNPSLDLVQKILNRWPEISPDWLVQGKGPMMLEDRLKEQANPDPVTVVKPVLEARTPVITPVVVTEKPILPEPEEVKEDSKENPAEPEPAPIIVSPNPVTKLEPRPQLALFDIPPVAAPIAAAPAKNPPVMDEKPAPVSKSASVPKAQPEKSVANSIPPMPPAPVDKEKKIQKIVFFYTDNTFSVFNPE